MVGRRWGGEKVSNETMYFINIGTKGPTDCCLKINEKEYLIETKAWCLIDIIYDYLINRSLSNTDIIIQNLLHYIYNNFDEDLREEGNEEDVKRNKEFFKGI